MEHHVSNQAAVAAVAWSILLGELRQHILASLLDNPLFSEAEQSRANHFAYECDDVARLTRWHANVLAEMTRREFISAQQRGQATLRATLRQLRHTGFRGYRPRQPAPTWVPGASLPDRADRPAGTSDRRAAAHFAPHHSLTLANLLTGPRA